MGCGAAQMVRGLTAAALAVAMQAPVVVLVVGTARLRLVQARKERLELGLGEY